MESSEDTADTGFTIFETALGTGGVAWRGTRVTAVAIPADRARTLARMRRATSGERADPPPVVARLCERIRALVAGEAVDLTDVVVDDGRIPAFDRRVYEIARSIPPGETLTYGEVARRLGDPRLARDVGAALGRNPTPLVVPCHRVVAADGGLGGFSAPGGRATKRRLLEIERPHAAPADTLFTI